LGTTDSNDLRMYTDSIHYITLSTKGVLEFLNTGNSVFIGLEAGGDDDFSVNANVGIGYQALDSIVSGAGNCAIGTQTLKSSKTGSENVAIGPNSMTKNTSGTRNIGIGSQALHQNTSGFNNSAIGFRSLYSNTTGVYNVAHGSGALLRSTTASFNTAIGVGASASSTTAEKNSCVGYYSFHNHKNGKENVAMGYYALFQDTSGDYNTAIGSYSMQKNFSGIRNVAIGYQSLVNSLGSGNVAIGHQAGYYETGSNKLYIDNSGVATPLIYGDFANDDLVINGDLSYTGNLTSLSDKRLKTEIQPFNKSLAVINTLKVYQFRYKEDLLRTVPFPSGIQTGLIAQDLEKVLPDLVHKHASDYKSVDYVGLLPHLVNAIQELSREVDQLKADLRAK